MHGGAQGQHHVGNVLIDAGGVSLGNIGGDGGNRGTGTQRHNSGTGDVLEHDLCSTLAAAKPCEEGESGEDVDEAQGIVDNHGAAIAFSNAGTVGGNQIGEDGEEGNGSIIGDDLNELHHHVGEACQPLAHDGLLAAGELHREAKEHGEHDQGKHGAAAQQTGEVADGEEVDDHVGHRRVLAHGLTGNIAPGLQHGREDLHQHVHDDSSQSAGDHEGSHGGAHDLTGTFLAFHIGDGAGDGSEDHGNDHAEHHVDEHGAQECDLMAKSGIEPAQQGTCDHGADQDRQKAVVLCDRFFVHCLLFPPK